MPESCCAPMRGCPGSGDRPGEPPANGDADVGDAVRDDAVHREDPQLLVLHQQKLRDICAHDAAEAGQQLIQEAV